MFPLFSSRNTHFSRCMTPKRQTWPVLSRSSWMTDKPPPGSTPPPPPPPPQQTGTSHQNAPMAYHVFFLFFFLTHWNNRLLCTHTPKVGAGGQGVVARGLTAALECLSCFFFFMLNGQKPKLERLISLLQTCCVCRFKSSLN